MENKVDSNSTGLAIAEEASLKVLPGTPVWYELEPNSYSNLGSEIKTVARNPINADRQKRKGVVVDIDASATFDMDFTNDIARRLFQGFLFANARQKVSTRPLNGTIITITNVTANTIEAASGLDAFTAGQRILLSGFTNASNNCVATITGVTAAALTVAETLVAEVPSATAAVEVVGVLCTADDLSLDLTASVLTLVSAGAIDFTTLSLNVGEFIFIGGDTAGSVFATAGSGYARIAAISASALTLDDYTFTAVSDAGTGKAIELYFGSVIRNELADNIVRKTYQIERQLGSDLSGTQAEYLIGSVANDLTLNLASANKIDVQLAFVALDHELRDTTEGLKGGTRIASAVEDAYNTTSNLFRAKIYTVEDRASVFAYATDMKLSVKNNVKALKALGVMGGFDATAGQFDVTGTTEAYLGDINSISSVRNNTDIGVNVIAAAHNKGFVLDMPLTSLGDGKLKVEKDNPIMVSLNIDAAKSAAGYTLLTVFFPYLPNSAMPVAE